MGPETQTRRAISKEQLAQAHYYARRLSEPLVDEYFAKVAAALRDGPRAMQAKEFTAVLASAFVALAPAHLRAYVSEQRDAT